MKPCVVQTFKLFICFNGQHFVSRDFLEGEVVAFYCSKTFLHCSRCFFMNEVIDILSKTPKSKIWFRIDVRQNNYSKAQIKSL